MNESQTADKNNSRDSLLIIPKSTQQFTKRSLTPSKHSKATHTHISIIKGHQSYKNTTTKQGYSQTAETLKSITLLPQPIK